MTQTFYYLFILYFFTYLCFKIFPVLVFVCLLLLLLLFIFILLYLRRILSRLYKCACLFLTSSDSYLTFYKIWLKPCAASYLGCPEGRPHEFMLLCCPAIPLVPLRYKQRKASSSLKSVCTSVGPRGYLISDIHLHISGLSAEVMFFSRRIKEGCQLTPKYSFGLVKKTLALWL